MDAYVHLEKEMLYVEFIKARPPSAEDLLNFMHPVVKARRLADYLHFLADVIEQGLAQGDSQGRHRAYVAQRAIHHFYGDQGLVHQQFVSVVFETIADNPQVPSATLAAIAHAKLLYSHPEEAMRMKIDRITAAVEACRSKERKSREARRAAGEVSMRWQTLAAALEGTGAKVSPESLRQAWYGRRNNKLPKTAIIARIIRKG